MLVITEAPVVTIGEKRVGDITPSAGRQNQRVPHGDLHRTNNTRDQQKTKNKVRRAHTRTENREKL